MTVRLVLTCDGCGKGTSVIATRGTSATTERWRTREQGWKTRMSDPYPPPWAHVPRVKLDYCPDCTPPKPGSRPAP